MRTGLLAFSPIVLHVLIRLFRNRGFLFAFAGPFFLFGIDVINQRVFYTQLVLFGASFFGARFFSSCFLVVAFFVALFVPFFFAALFLVVAIPVFKLKQQATGPIKFC